jgi:hypothetical protein
LNWNRPTRPNRSDTDCSLRMCSSFAVEARCAFQ